MQIPLTRLSMYYEEYGDATAQPVVLLHGGLSGAQTWVEQVGPLSDRYRVLVPEQRGHCHTGDVDGPLTYQRMAEDTIEFLESVALCPAHLVGHSDGGILALLIAMQRPDLLDRAVVIGANFHKDGLHLPVAMSADPFDERFNEARERYASSTPDGADHWPVIFGKTHRMMLSEPTLSTKQLAAISTPMLVMAGDDDVIAHPHTVELFEAIQEGQLAVIPGTSHGVKKEKPEIVNRVILDFLAETMLPSELKSVRKRG